MIENYGIKKGYKSGGRPPKLDEFWNEERIELATICQYSIYKYTAELMKKKSVY